jgi:hypothetical protein
VTGKKRLRICIGVLLNAVQYIVVLWECETVGALIADERVAIYPLLVNNIVKLIDKLLSP